MADKEMTELDIYQTYMRNVRLTEEIQSDIIRGAKAGEDPFALLLMALKAIGLMTGTDILYKDVELSMRAIYGQALGMKGPVSIELANAKERLEKIRATMATCEPGENLERMKQAVKSHEALIARLTQQLEDQA